MINLILADGGYAVWHQDARIWVTVCLIGFFMLLAFKGAHKAAGKALDDRAVKIGDELSEARRLREEAQTLLASYHRKQKEAEDLAEQIVTQAKRDAEVMAENARTKLSEQLERRAEMAEAKIVRAEAQALSEVRSRAADIALEATEDFLRTNVKAANQSKLVKDGIAQMGNLLN